MAALARRRGVRLPRDAGQGCARGRHRRVLRQRRRRAARGRARRAAPVRARRSPAARSPATTTSARRPARATSASSSRSGCASRASSSPTTSTASATFLAEVGPWVRDGKLQYRETIVDGFENLPAAFAGLFRGDNTGKMLVRVGPGLAAARRRCGRAEQVLPSISKSQTAGDGRRGHGDRAVPVGQAGDLAPLDDRPSRRVSRTVVAFGSECQLELSACAVVDA